MQFRQSISKKAGGKYINRIEQKLAAQVNKPEQSYALNPMDEIFQGDILSKAKELEKQENQSIESNKNSNKIVKNKSGIKIKKKSVVNKKNKITGR